MKRVLTLLIITLFTASAAAQQSIPLQKSSESDLQGRFQVSMEIPISQKVSLTWSEQLRTKESFGSLDKILSTASISYSPIKFLELGSDYAFVNEKSDDDWCIKHRWNINIIEKLTLGRFELSLRERLRMEFRGYKANRFESPNPFTTLRIRLKAAYKNASRWKPYIYTEIYSTLNAPAPVENYLYDQMTRDNYCNRVRIVVGSELKINQKSKMDFHYMLNLNRTYSPSYNAATGNLHSWALEKVCAHVICVDYKFSL